MTRKQRASRVLLNAGAVWELINRLNMSQGDRTPRRHHTRLSLAAPERPALPQITPQDRVPNAQILGNRF